MGIVRRSGPSPTVQAVDNNATPGRLLTRSLVCTWPCDRGCRSAQHTYARPRSLTSFSTTTLHTKETRVMPRTINGTPQNNSQLRLGQRGSKDSPGWCLRRGATLSLPRQLGGPGDDQSLSHISEPVPHTIIECMRWTAICHRRLDTSSPAASVTGSR